MPSIASALQVDSASRIWITNGYQVASAATMLICASLGSRIGEKRFYTAGQEIGYGFARGNTQRISMRVVRIVIDLQEYNGKPYYILTAFPTP